MERKKRESCPISEKKFITNNEHLVLLLQLVKRNGNIESLHNQGYQYSEIAQLLNLVIDDKLAYYTEEGLTLSSKGESLLLELNKNLQRKNSEAMISPQTEYLINKISRYDIYLPLNYKNLK